MSSAGGSPPSGAYAPAYELAYAPAYAPVAAALLDRARADGAALLARARDDAEAAGARASEEAAALLAAARADGEEEADRLLAAERTAARRRAHELVLAARRAALEDVRGRCRDAAAELPSRSDYPQLLDGLARTARQVLGEQAVLECDGPEGPGVVARSGSLRLDLRLSTLAERAIESLGPELESLWR